MQTDANILDGTQRATPLQPDRNLEDFFQKATDFHYASKPSKSKNLI